MKKFMNNPYGGWIGLLILLLAIPLVAYGTLSPCEMLKKEVLAQLQKKYLTTGNTASAWEQLGSVLGLAIGGKVVEGLVDTMSPVDCGWKLLRVKFGSEGLLQGGYTQQPPSGMPTYVRQTNCKIENWTWRNAQGGLDLLFVEGIISPATVSTVHIQAFDANDNYLGNGTGWIQPGGSFSATVSKPNPTSELRLKYTCQ